MLTDAILKKELRKNDILFDPKEYGIREYSTNLDYRRKFSFNHRAAINDSYGIFDYLDQVKMSQFHDDTAQEYVTIFI